MLKVRTIVHRLYSDYLLENRFSEYQKIIEWAINNTYIVTSLIDYYHMVRKQSLDNTKVLILRHDIDTDVIGAREFFNIEKRLGVKSSFYFRLSTLDREFINEIVQYGSEASYHYEEIATYCKIHKIRDKDRVNAEMSEIRKLFIQNYLHLKESTGLPLLSVASHGDFVNQYIGLSNQVFLNTEVRERCGILLEAYDQIIKKDCLSISDTGYPRLWNPFSPQDALLRNVPKINLLTHPRHWRSNIYINTRDNINRMIEGIKYFYC